MDSPEYKVMASVIEEYPLMIGDGIEITVVPIHGGTLRAGNQCAAGRQC